MSRLAAERPRRDRWLTLIEVGEQLKKHQPSLGSLTRANLRRYVRRLVRRVERRDNERYTTRSGRQLFVSRNALESLRPYDAEAFIAVEHRVAELAQNHRTLQRQVNGHGSRLRSLLSRVEIIEKKQELTARFMAEYAALDGAIEPPLSQVRATSTS